MLAVGPLGPQYCRIFACHELGRHAHLDYVFNENNLTLDTKNWQLVLYWYRLMTLKLGISVNNLLIYFSK